MRLKVVCKKVRCFMSDDLKLELVDLRGEVVFGPLDPKGFLLANRHLPGLISIIKRLGGGEEGGIIEGGEVVLDGAVVGGGELGLRVWLRNRAGQPWGWVPGPKGRRRKVVQDDEDA